MKQKNEINIEHEFHNYLQSNKLSRTSYIDEQFANFNQYVISKVITEEFVAEVFEFLASWRNNYSRSVTDPKSKLAQFNLLLNENFFSETGIKILMIMNDFSKSQFLRLMNAISSLGLNLFVNSSAQNAELIEKVMIRFEELIEDELEVKDLRSTLSVIEYLMKFNVFEDGYFYRIYHLATKADPEFYKEVFEIIKNHSDVNKLFKNLFAIMLEKCEFINTLSADDMEYSFNFCKTKNIKLSLTTCQLIKNRCSDFLNLEERKQIVDALNQFPQELISDIGIIQDIENAIDIACPLNGSLNKNTPLIPNNFKGALIKINDFIKLNYNYLANAFKVNVEVFYNSPNSVDKAIIRNELSLNNHDNGNWSHFISNANVPSSLIPRFD